MDLYLDPPLAFQGRGVKGEKEGLGGQCVVGHTYESDHSWRSTGPLALWG